MSRKKARESVILLLYHWDMVGHGEANFATTLGETVVGEIVKETEPLTEDDDLYINSIIEGIKQNVEQLDSTIEAATVGWKLDRLPKVDLAILRLGVFELLYRQDIPDAVTINECVDVAKHYSTDNSGPFINGVLSTIMKNKPTAP